MNNIYDVNNSVFNIVKDSTTGDIKNINSIQRSEEIQWEKLMSEVDKVFKQYLDEQYNNPKDIQWLKNIKHCVEQRNKVTLMQELKKYRLC